MLLADIYNRLKFWSEADRIGPDIPLTHWRLHFKSAMRRLCVSKFLRFGVGSEFRAGAYAVCCSKISLGDRVIIRPGCMLFADPRIEGAGITIEDDVMLGSGVHIYVHNHKFDDPSVPIIDQGHCQSEPVVLERGSWIGAAAIILPGVVIGRNAVVGAGSVVTRDVPAFTIVVGNPARVLRRIKAD
jgi:acetyltransferase-like isoleucine patch superfamily enzyme